MRTWMIRVFVKRKKLCVGVIWILHVQQVPRHGLKDWPPRKKNGKGFFFHFCALFEQFWHEFEFEMEFLGGGPAAKLDRCFELQLGRSGLVEKESQFSFNSSCLQGGVLCGVSIWWEDADRPVGLVSTENSVLRKRSFWSKTLTSHALSLLGKEGKRCRGWLFSEQCGK